MTVNELINELAKYDPNLPVCINDYMGFIEATENCIKVEPKNYLCFPFTECDKFEYINLRSKEYEN